MLPLLPLLALLLLAGAARAYALLPRRAPAPAAAAGPNAAPNAPRPQRTTPAKLAVFLGSGGHTSESLQLLRALPPARYTPRAYIVSAGDGLSQQKAEAFERSLAPPAGAGAGQPQHAQSTFLLLPRARRVHQPLLLTAPTALYALLAAFWHITLLPALRREPFADVLLLNGPGTCVVVLAAVWISKFLGLPAPRTIYVESFARVRSLSLSAKLVRPFVDRFVVQWPDALGPGNANGRGECRGWLV